MADAIVKEPEVNLELALEHRNRFFITLLSGRAGRLLRVCRERNRQLGNIRREVSALLI